MTDFAQRALLAVKKRIWLALPRPEVWLPVAVRLANVVLVVLLAGSLAQLTLTILSGWRSPSIRMASALGSSDAEPASPAGRVDYAAIAAWHLFGRVEANQAVVAPPPVIPATPLNLRLVGVFFVERGNDRALALIAEGNGLERGYRVGDPLPGGARLELIQRDHVMVARQGRREVLNLPKLDEAARRPSTPPAEAVPESEPEPEPTGSAVPQVIDATAVAQQLRDEAGVRPQVLEKIAFASPYLQNGQFIGFRLRPGRDRRLMQQLSLNNGDVITEVNGTRISNPMQGFTLLQEVLGADRISVRVLRDGAEIPLLFSLNGPVP
ncbi:MAG: type II secretion system protein N [Candidatus Competibacter sp.]|nr:type II secretion system protein N [Candidatus Competibacter sp.]MDG4583992.1 type II secretion system protein N [Candidatus Competibacter sp.]